MTASLAPMHLGSLHTYETVLLFVLAFGPFAVLGVVVARQRRRDAAADGDGADVPPTDGAAGGVPPH